jgi:predicted ATPase
MHLNRFRVQNYKCFEDTGWLDLSSKFNVVVGQNNSGKTALAEAFRLHQTESKPHRSLRTKPGPLNPRSTFSVEIASNGVEINAFARTHGMGLQIPVQAASGREQGEKLVSQLLEKQELTLELDFWQNNVVSPFFPSHRLFPDEGEIASIEMKISPDRQSIEFAKYATSRSDNLPAIIGEMCRQTIYVFKAERLNVGKCNAHEAPHLNPDCSNLPAVLLNLSANKSRFERLNRYLAEIFPSIRWVSVVTTGNDFEIRIWSHDLASEREDLAVPLSESGTGVGQVLGILYVALTRQPSVIVIDEPNSFLHPGAAKKLMQILKQCPHQYIVSTHSPELISTINADVVHFVRREDGISAVSQIDAQELAGMRDVLGDLGASLTDVFGYDKIIWVEGTTEQECFPRVLGAKSEVLPLGVGFVAVKQVGDFEARRNNPRLVVSVYNKLAQRSPLLPVAVAFSFDREKRKEAEIARMRADLGDSVHFLPRATYENYLLHPLAIAALLTGDLEGKKVSADDVSSWLAKKVDLTSDEDLKNCDAAKLLALLFMELSEKTLEYRKTSHSVALTNWILANDAAHLAELSAYVSSLVRGLRN